MTTFDEAAHPREASGSGRFATARRDEPAVSLDTAGADPWEGCWSVDDFTREQRAGLDSVHRHAYDWAHARVGSLGMENTEYAEDYAGWVARRLVELDFDVEALGSHTQMVKEWDVERASALAEHVSQRSGINPAGLAGRMARGKVLPDADLGTGKAGRDARADLAALLGSLRDAGIRVDDAARTLHGGRGWSITGMDGDRAPHQVWVSGQRGPRFD